MRTIIHLLLFLFITATAEAQSSTAEQETLKLSKDKWQWMADKNLGKLQGLFDDKSVFARQQRSDRKTERQVNHV